jgi:hypothetical protein
MKARRGGGASSGSSSVSVGELWPRIDKLDEVGPVGTSAVPMQDRQRDLPSRSVSTLEG